MSDDDDIVTSTYLVIVPGLADPYFGVVIDGCAATSAAHARNVLAASLGARNAKLAKIVEEP